METTDLGPLADTLLIHDAAEDTLSKSSEYSDADVIVYDHADLTADDLEFKGVQGTLGVDSAKGIVEAIVAVTGNKDRVKDIIMPGGFNEGLKHVKPKVVWGHDWNQPIGKVLEVYEIMPNDKRLPKRLRNAGFGALYAKVQFNLKSEKGREAFASVVFFGDEQEWSIGYKTKVRKYDPAKDANLLYEVHVYECSPVLHGANAWTSTLSAKDAKSAMAPQIAAMSDAVKGRFGDDAVLKGRVGDYLLLMLEDQPHLVEYNEAIEGKDAFGVPVRISSECGGACPVDGHAEMSHACGKKDCDGSCGHPECGHCGGKSLADDIKNGESDVYFDDGETNVVVDGDTISVKIGKVISARNATKLRQALELLQDVLGSNDTLEATVEEKTEEPTDALSRWEARAGMAVKAVVVGKPETLSGRMVTVPVRSLDEVAQVVDALDVAVKGGAAILAPTKPAWQGRGEVNIFVGVDKKSAATVADAVAGLDLDFSVEVLSEEPVKFGDLFPAI